METPEAINQADEAVLMPKQGVWYGYIRSHLKRVLARVARRPLFQKVTIANSILIALGTTMGLYLAKGHFEAEELSFLFVFIIGGVLTSIVVNFLLMRLAFRPLDDVTKTLKHIRGGNREMRVPEVRDDPQVQELSRTLNSMLNELERQRKRDARLSIKAQEDERKRISRELHDETSQSLTGLVLKIRAIEDLVPPSHPEIMERLLQVKEVAHSTLNEVHTMAVRLRPSVLDDLGLAAGLRSYVKEFSETTGIRVNLSQVGLAERLPAELETVLYRVVQEALTNVARHSGANRCSVTLERSNSVIRGEVADNGCGFDPDAALRSERNSGLGLHGMKERIELVGGTLSFDSIPGGGSTLNLEVPLKTREGV